MNSSIFQTLDRNPQRNYTRRELACRVLWHVVQATLYRISLPRAYGWRRLLLRLFGAKLGRDAAVHRSTRIMHPWLLEMGDWTTIGPRSTVYNLGAVTIGDHTVVSQDVYLCAGTHDYTDPRLPLQKPGITVGSGVWIAAGAFIGPGATIGANSVIGARSVVIGAVPDNVVAAGNPCRVIKPRIPAT